MFNNYICRKCGAEISRNAKHCPHCGEPLPGTIIGEIIMGILLAPVILILIFVAIAFYRGLLGFV